jgi:hypothetical protein
VNFTESDPENASFTKRFQSQTRYRFRRKTRSAGFNLYAYMEQRGISKTRSRINFEAKYTNWELIIVDDFSPNFLTFKGLLKDWRTHA